jgi:hypothetical protein
MMNARKLSLSRDAFGLNIPLRALYFGVSSDLNEYTDMLIQGPFGSVLACGTNELAMEVLNNLSINLIVVNALEKNKRVEFVQNARRQADEFIPAISIIESGESPTLKDQEYFQVSLRKPLSRMLFFGAVEYALDLGERLKTADETEKYLVDGQSERSEETRVARESCKRLLIDVRCSKCRKLSLMQRSSFGIMMCLGCQGRYFG